MRTVLNRRRLPLAGGVVLLTALSACGSAAAGGAAASVDSSSDSSTTMTMPMPSSDTTAASAPVATDHVVIQGFAFGPQVVTVKVGATVTWTQDDEDSHTVTADNGSFTSQPLANGQTYTHTFTAAGTFTYHCSIHPFMHGTVVVSNG